MTKSAGGEQEYIRSNHNELVYENKSDLHRKRMNEGINATPARRNSSAYLSDGGEFQDQRRRHQMELCQETTVQDKCISQLDRFISRALHCNEV